MKSKKKKKKRKKVLISFCSLCDFSSFHFQIFHFPFFCFLLFCPFLPCLSFPSSSAEISWSEVSGGALCPVPLSSSPHLLCHCKHASIHTFAYECATKVSVQNSNLSVLGLQPQRSQTGNSIGFSLTLQHPKDI